MVDLIFVVEQRRGDELHWSHRDYCCGVEAAGRAKNDVCFVDEAWWSLIGTGVFEGVARIDVFTYGGGRHFKSVYAAPRFAIADAEWREAARESGAAPPPRVYWNYWVSYHGHSLCDSHAGHVKRALTRAQGNAQHAAV